MSSEAGTVLITGAAGYLGSMLVGALVDDCTTKRSNKPKLILSDVTSPKVQGSSHVYEGHTFIQASLTEPDEVERLFTTPRGIPDTIYCLHGIMSRGAEDNFDLGMKVNFDSVRNLLEAARKYGTVQPIKFIFTSSLAVYGGPLPDIVTPSTVATPQGTYGVSKLLSELLINEYTRRGYVDGRILRLPTVIIRPGSPSAAASSFISGIIREPLNGQESICPIGNSLDSPELGLPLWLTSAATVIQNLLLSREVPAPKFMDHTRVVCLPGFTATVRDELEALRIVGGEEALRLVKFEDDPKSRQLVSSWPSKFDNGYALSLGFVVDEDGMEGIVKKYYERLKTPLQM